MIKKYIFALALSIAAIGANASNSYIDTTGMSDAQVAELKSIAAAKVAELAQQKAVNDGQVILPKDPGAVATLAATWGQQAAAAAEGFAKALSIAAKELGITINEFLGTPAGKLTAALIIWKVAGASIMHLLYAMIFMIVCLTIAKVIYMRLFTERYEQVEYSRFGGFFKGTKLIRIPKTFKDLKNDGEWLAWWIMLIVVFASLIGFGLIIG